MGRRQSNTCIARTAFWDIWDEQQVISLSRPTRTGRLVDADRLRNELAGIGLVIASYYPGLLKQASARGLTIGDVAMRLIEWGATEKR
jgi:hypothetical protein